MASQHGSIASAIAAAVGSITGTAGKGLVFKLTVAGAETVNVTGAIDSTTVSSKIMCYSLLTGALHSTVDMVSGTYYIPKCYTDSIIFTASAGVELKSVSWRICDNV